MAGWFTCLITLQFILIAMHDLVDIPGWVMGSQVQAVIGRGKIWFATPINAIFPGIAAGLAIWFYRQPKPTFVLRYWAIYSGVTVLSAIAMWYIPYFLGANERQKSQYLRMYAGTRHILPARGDNPRPNLFHIGMHVLFLFNFCAALMFFFTRA